MKTDVNCFAYRSLKQAQPQLHWQMRYSWYTVGRSEQCTMILIIAKNRLTGVRVDISSQIDTVWGELLPKQLCRLLKLRRVIQMPYAVTVSKTNSAQTCCEIVPIVWPSYTYLITSTARPHDKLWKGYGPRIGFTLTLKI